MTDHPVTPPPELVHEWDASWRKTKHAHENYSDYIATQAARWGADQELEACVEWMAERYGQESHAMGLLCAARRPKPPSLRQQALAVIENSEICDHLSTEHAAILRRALEQLDD